MNKRSSTQQTEKMQGLSDGKVFSARRHSLKKTHFDVKEKLRKNGNFGRKWIRINSLFCRKNGPRPQKGLGGMKLQNATNMAVQIHRLSAKFRVGVCPSQLKTKPMTAPIFATIITLEKLNSKSKVLELVFS